MNNVIQPYLCPYLLAVRLLTVRVLTSNRVCLSICVFVPRRIPRLLHGPGCYFGEWHEVPFSCALMGGLAIGAWGSLLWQHTRLMRNVSEDGCTPCMAGHPGRIHIVTVTLWFLRH